ncbi:hypothetical protein GCM10020220_054270 [Nonomuraea rubra]|uniref:hypothetical protein n=1 Tax=Nonomuraea rubra TaxID=46180 RepID=UPI0031F1A3AE
MNMTLAELTSRTGLTVLDHLEQSVRIPVLDGLQAQGDLIVIPMREVDVTVWGDARWQPVPAEGVELLRGAAGGNPHTLVAEAGHLPLDQARPGRAGPGDRRGRRHRSRLPAASRTRGLGMRARYVRGAAAARARGQPLPLVAD